MQKIIRFVQEEFIFFIFFSILLVLSAIFPSEIKNFPEFVEWKTIWALAGLIIITTGMKESGYFELITIRMLKKVNSERGVSFSLVLLSVVLSTFLTNDIALFIVIPVTLAVQKRVKNNISKLVIFEAIAVNVGSTFSPIGNPQNIFLWHKWNISFTGYVWEMLPVGLIQLGFLLIFIFFVFRTSDLQLSGGFEKRGDYKKLMFNISLLLLILFIITLELKITEYVLPFIFIFYLVAYREIFKKVDWLLIILFIVIFIEFHLISNISFISENIKAVNPTKPANVFWLSGLISQIISNVPAAVMMSKFSNNWQAIAFGVNIGGNGLVIGSLANIIALRMINSKKCWIDFHKYSVIYFIVTFVTVLVIFY